MNYIIYEKEKSEHVCKKGTESARKDFRINIYMTRLITKWAKN